MCCLHLKYYAAEADSNLQQHRCESTETVPDEDTTAVCSYDDTAKALATASRPKINLAGFNAEFGHSHMKKTVGWYIGPITRKLTHNVSCIISSLTYDPTFFGFIQPSAGIN